MWAIPRRFCANRLLLNQQHMCWLTTNRLVYGDGSGVCLCFASVYEVLWCAALLWMSLSLILLSLGWLWPPSGSLGMLVGPFGSLGSFWLPFGSLGMPVRPFWATLGSKVEPEVTLGQKCTSSSMIFEAFVMPACKKRPCGIQPRIRIRGILQSPPIPAQRHKSRSFQPRFSCAGGQDDMNLEQTPSNNKH